MWLALEIARNNSALIAIFAPFIGAAICALCPANRWATAPALIAALIAALAAGDLAWRALSAGAAPPIAESGLALDVDGIGAFTGALIAATGVLIVMAAPAFLSRSRQTPYALALALIALAGALGAVYASDLATMFAATQAGALACVGLAALNGARARGALAGAIRLLVVNGVAGALFLAGAAVIARATGSLLFEDFTEASPSAASGVAIGAVLAIAALAMQAGVAPLHGWVGAFFGRAGGFGALVASGLTCIAALAALARIAAATFAAPAAGEGLSEALLTLGLVSVAIGSLQAAGARDLRRLAAYAAAAQAGCFLVATAMGSAAGFAAALVQLGAMSATAVALHAAAPPASDLAALDGLARRAPIASAALAASAFNLMGAPLTLGFLGRWRLIEVGVGGGWWWGAAAVIVVSLTAAFYGARLIERLYFRRAAIAQDDARDPMRLFVAPALTVAVAAILYGVDPAVLLRAADAAGRFLTGASP